MSELKTVGIKELKNNLSAYLRDVRRGTRVLVSDRNRVVAELHEPTAGYTGDASNASNASIDPLLAQWVDAGVVLPPSVEKAELPRSPVRLKEGAADRLLDADRVDAGS